MPIAQRRHPVYLRLQKPVEPIYPDAVTAVAWDDDKPLEDVEGVAYIVTRPCAQMRSWARGLRNLHRLDESFKMEEGISQLSATPIDASSLRGLGVWDGEILGRRGLTVRSPRSGECTFQAVDLMAVVLDRVGGNPVGFVSFALKWMVHAFAKNQRGVDLEIEPGQAWITPEFRGRRWGELAAIAIAMTTRRHVNQVEASTRWPSGFTAELNVTVGADIYSKSGEAFLGCCAQYVEFELDSR